MIMEKSIPQMISLIFVLNMILFMNFGKCHLGPKTSKIEASFFENIFPMRASSTSYNENNYAPGDFRQRIAKSFGDDFIVYLIDGTIEKYKIPGQENKVSNIVLVC
ncbi:hypothetical protein ACJX0J_007236 [Zea mays]